MTIKEVIQEFDDKYLNPMLAAKEKYPVAERVGNPKYTELAKKCSFLSVLRHYLDKCSSDTELFREWALKKVSDFERLKIGEADILFPEQIEALLTLKGQLQILSTEDKFNYNEYGKANTTETLDNK